MRRVPKRNRPSDSCGSLRIKALAAAEGISSVEISGQRLMLHRNGDYILLEGRRFPRLKSASPHGKLTEAVEMLRTF